METFVFYVGNKEYKVDDEGRVTTLALREIEVDVYESVRKLSTAYIYMKNKCNSLQKTNLELLDEVETLKHEMGQKQNRRKDGEKGKS